ncbi:MAG: thioredoxin family protein [Bacilli bacterium]|nr:thioredoxin family protein [Bacilli bacterium]
MKKTFGILIILCLGFVTGCSNSVIKKIDYKEFNDLIENQKTFILYVGSASCSNCIEFEPKFKEIIKDHNIRNARYIDLDKFNDEEKNKLNKIINISGTPTVIFIENGEEESMTNRINGNISKEKIISRLKSNNYIK